MKNATPRQIAWYSILMITGLLILVLIIIKFLFPYIIHWSMIIIIPIIVLIAGYYVFSISMENFVYRRIKLIYKTIYENKLPEEKKSTKQSGNSDIINFAESEVIEWKNNASREKRKQKQLENFRKEFLANVFHELKTPLFNIQGYLETLIEGGINDDKINEKFLKKARKNVGRMAEIVDDLQMISNLEDGSFALSEAKFDITKLVTEVLEQHEIRADKKKIEVNIKDGCEKSFYVVADFEMIQQVLNNLITNSIKYGKEEGRTQIGIYDMNENVLIEVSDNGLGIESKHLPRIFERFYRADKNRSREMGGSGLGLSIVKHIIEAHGQTLNVRSTPGIGSTFGFTLKKSK